MIREVIDAVQNGEAACFVFGHTYDFAISYMLPMAERELAHCRVPFKRVSQNELDADGSQIVFLSKAADKDRIIGRRGRTFVDHAAWPLYPKRTAPKELAVQDYKNWDTLPISTAKDTT